MLTKLPDYIVSDCGYPDWSVGEKENIKLAKIQSNLWSTSAIWSTKSSNFVKLLPLRETLTDYYMDKLMMKQKESSSMYKTSTQQSSITTKNNCGRPAQKQLNELINNAKRKQLKQQQQPCLLDKRRFHTNSSDNDLDQF